MITVFFAAITVAFFGSVTAMVAADIASVHTKIAG
jgi:hypothetical protein